MEVLKNNMDIRKKLIELREEEYRLFQQKLIPNQENILGIRIPKLRSLAKEIAKGDWENYLRNSEEEHFEEIMLKGMVIGYIKVPLEQRLELIKWFVPKIDNWSVCDSFCVGLKFAKKHREEVWDFLMPYLQSNKEFEIRFAVVMLLNYFLEKEYIEECLKIFNSIQHDGYYVKMGVAWAISIAYIKFPNETEKLLLQNDLDDFTYNKALQKITESYRIDQETKEKIRNMKRKYN